MSGLGKPVPLVGASVPSEQTEDLEDGEVDKDDSEMLHAPIAEEAPSAGPGTGTEQKNLHKRRKRTKHSKPEGGVAKPKKEKRKKRSKVSGFRGHEEQELVKPG